MNPLSWNQYELMKFSMPLVKIAFVVGIISTLDGWWLWNLLIWPLRTFQNAILTEWIYSSWKGFKSFVLLSRKAFQRSFATQNWDPCLLPTALDKLKSFILILSGLSGLRCSQFSVNKFFCPNNKRVDVAAAQSDFFAVLLSFLLARLAIFSGISTITQTFMSDI